MLVPMGCLSRRGDEISVFYLGTDGYIPVSLLRLHASISGDLWSSGCHRLHSNGSTMRSPPLAFPRLKTPSLKDACMGLRVECSDVVGLGCHLSSCTDGFGPDVSPLPWSERWVLRSCLRRRSSAYAGRGGLSWARICCRYPPTCRSPFRPRSPSSSGRSLPWTGSARGWTPSEPEPAACIACYFLPSKK